MLHEQALVDDGDAVADEAHHGQIVGDEQIRQPPRLLQFGEQVEYLRADGHVQRRNRLVGDDAVSYTHLEPLEMGAGYAFGAWEGTILCIIGCVIGSALVFLFVRRFGVKLVEVFFPREKIRSLRFLQDSRRLNLLTFIVFFIPGTPKDLLSYFIGLTDMKLGTWLLITAVARIPSIVTSTVTGDALGLKDYQFALIAFGVTLALSLAGILVYRRLSARRHPNG